MNIYRMIHPTPEQLHPCVSWVEMPFMYLSCPKCGFSAKMNLESGEKEQLSEGDPWAFHSGYSSPVILELDTLSKN